MDHSKNQSPGFDFGKADAGYNEGGFAKERSPDEVEKARKRAESIAKQELRKKNLSAVFGQGPGKFAIIVLGVAFVSFGVLGYVGLSRDATQGGEGETKFDMQVRAPKPKTRHDPVTQDEATRIAEVSQREAMEAREKGQGYLSELLPTHKENVRRAGQPVVFPVSKHEAQANLEQQREAERVQREQQQLQRQQQRQLQQQQQQQQQLQQQMAAETAEQAKKREEARQKYIGEIRGNVLTQVDSLFTATQAHAGHYRTAAYSPPLMTSRVGAMAGNALEKATRQLLIKTGQTFYATLDSEVNTDDGGHVLATVRGGVWDGSKLIGRIEQGPNNIRLRFSTLAPQDHRPTMNVDAVAIREEDGKQGVAEDIDRHIFERYTSLLAASALTGLGQAASVNTGRVEYLPNGTTVVTNDEVSDRRIIGYSLGEMGRSAGAEIRRGFNRPTTFSTPANQGIGVYFLRDVYSGNEN